VLGEWLGHSPARIRSVTEAATADPTSHTGGG
jgi:hypothetical protein